MKKRHNLFDISFWLFKFSQPNRIGRIEFSSPQLIVKAMWIDFSSCAQEEDALDTVTATESYTEQGHDAAAIFVHGMAVTSFIRWRVDQFGPTGIPENTHDVKNSAKRGDVLGFYG